MDKAKRKDEKIKVLVLGDSPTCSTGFATVIRNILKVLWETGKYEFDVVGINYDGEYYDRDKFPYRIYPAVKFLVQHPLYGDLFGRQALLDMLGTGRYDLLFILQDTFIMETLGPKILQTNDQLPPDKKFVWVYYFPIDAVPKKGWVDASALLADFPVAYTNYGYNECMRLYHVGEDTKLEEREQENDRLKHEILKRKLGVIYHGVNLKDFYPIGMGAEKKGELRKKWFGEDNVGKFVFMNLNRNQPRKDMARSLAACKRLLDRRRAKGKDDVYFYFHCHVQDMSGIDLIDVSKQLRFVEGNEWAYPNPKHFMTSYGFPVKDINELYNICDCVFSTTLGEGFGFSGVEAMATRTPVILPDNTTGKELVGNNERGLLVRSGATDSDFVVMPHDNSRIRPTTDVGDLVDKMEWVIENKEKVGGMADRAYKWVSRFGWDGEEVGGKWKKVFEDAYERMLAFRRIAKKEQEVDWGKMGRNDKCPICSAGGKKVKIKHCVHGAKYGQAKAFGQKETEKVS